MQPREQTVTRMNQGVRVHLNLANRPHGGYRALFLLACSTAALLLLTGVLLVLAFFGESQLPAEHSLQQQQLLAEQQELNQLIDESSAKIRDPLAMEILDRTDFLNQLLIRKGISWSHAFLDIEKVLPANVRVVMIQPEIALGDMVQLDMTVSAKSPGDFIAFLKTLEASEFFGSTSLRGSTPPNESDETYRYKLAVSYEQKLEN